MKITHVITDGNVGGAGLLAAAIAEELAGEFETEIILPQGSRLSERISTDRLKLTHLPYRSDVSADAAAIPVFVSHFRKTRPDVLHSHASVTARLCAKLSGVPYCISTRHCAVPSDSVKRHGMPRRLLYSLLTDLTVSTAEYATDNLIAEGVDKKRIKTVYNGVKKREKPDTDAILCKKAELKIPPHARVIGSVGRLEAVKGQDLLIRAAPELMRLFPDLYIVFVGTGSCKRRLCELASLLGVDKRIRFTGYVSDPHGVQAMFYTNVNPSRGTETSCLAISECMSMGIPTVASDFGGNREMITDGLNGLLFQTDSCSSLISALCRILSDGELYKRLCRGAEDRYNELFSFSRMIDEYRNIYTHLGVKQV